MTLEEEKEFRQKVIQTVLPLAINMTEDQIRSIIQNVEKSNEDFIIDGDIIIEEEMKIYLVVLEQCFFNKLLFINIIN